MRLGLVTTYAPRRHELAGPAAELARCLAERCEVHVAAVDRHGLEYPDEVTTVIADDDRDDYHRAARVLAECGTDAVLIEFDDGVFGGPAGSHILELTHQLRLRGIPYLVRLHSLGPAEGAGHRLVAGLAGDAAAVLVPSASAAREARARRIADPNRTIVVPPGVARRDPAEAPPGRPAVARLLREHGEGRLLAVLGPVGPDQGLERVLEGFAKIVVDHPDVRLLLAETTYPESGSQHHDGYPERLRSLAVELAIDGRVAILTDRLGAADRARVLGRTEVLLVPRPAPDRLFLPVLAEAQVAGCPVVAAAHPFAVEVLAGGAGAILPAADASALSATVGRLLGDASVIAAARARAGVTGRRFALPAVASRLVDAARHAMLDAAPGWAVSGAPPIVPVRLVDPAGELQGPSEHALLALVTRHLVGIGAPVVESVPAGGWPSLGRWARRALGGLISDTGSPGWRVRGLAALCAPGLPAEVQDRATRTLDTLAVAIAGPTRDDAALERDALVVVGLREGLRVSTWRAGLARLHAARRAASRGAAWPWFTDHLTEAGARLPHALIVGARAAGEPELVGQGVESLDWYLRRVGLGDVDGVLALPTPDGETATAVAALVEALVDAYQVTRSSRYARLAVRAFAWFAGVNRYAEPAYDPDQCRCRERVGPALERYPAGAGLAYLSAALTLRHAGLVRLGIAPVRGDLAAAA